ncbi:MAG: sensor domain-containing diguanylate cyclase [Oceanospirillaceae bacterium]
MSDMPIPANEESRLIALDAYRIMDTLPEREYDDIAMLAAFVCGVDKAMVAFIDGKRKWHKARYNIKPIEVPRNFAICSHTIMSSEPLIISDTHLEPIIADVGMVINPPHVRFYAGVPLLDEEGHAIGTLCAIDTKPHSGLSLQQVNSLQALARQVMSLLKLRSNLLFVKASEQRLRNLSITDHLTGLYNRRAFLASCEIELSRAKRHDGRFSILMIDIDNFKRVNDEYGHSVGDQVLIDVANSLKLRTRASDLCARYGGEEFVVILGQTNVKQALSLAESYRNAVQKGFDQQSVTISIGVAEYIVGDTVMNCIDRADVALLKAKSSGRNRSIVHGEW